MVKEYLKQMEITGRQTAFNAHTVKRKFILIMLHQSVNCSEYNTTSKITTGGIFVPNFKVEPVQRKDVIIRDYCVFK